MFKLRVFQIIYFLLTAIDMIIGGIGFLFMTIAKPFDYFADQMMIIIKDLNDKLEKTEKENK